MESLIRDIGELAHDIYTSYNQPKIKFGLLIKYKKWIIKRRLLNLKIAIDETFDNCAYINYTGVVDYFSNIGLAYPPNGKYAHTNLVKSHNLENEVFASFSFPVNHIDKKYVCNVILGYNKESYKGLNLIYSLRENDNTILQFTDESVTFLDNSNKFNPELYKFNLNTEGDILRYQFCTTLILDIKDFINQKIEFYIERIDEL